MTSVKLLAAIVLAALALAGQPAVPADIELADCRLSAGPAYPGIDARCGNFEVPLDPGNPGGETIALRIAVVPALSLEPAADAIAPIAGGPGQGTIEFYAQAARAFEPLRRERDILLVDQRGTGDSLRLDCASDDDVLQGSLTREQTIALTQTCLDSLPADPRYFTTSVAVRDLDAVRAALGYEALNVYGISYGSRVAQHYARRFPESTRTVILDGVVPPQLALGPDIAIEAQKAVDRLLERCIESAPCQAAFPDIGERFAALEARLTETPVAVDIAHPRGGRPETVILGEDEFAGAIRLLAYHPSTIALIPLLVNEAYEERYAPLAAQFVNIRDSLADSLSAGMHNAVVCTEDAPFFAGAGVSNEELAATYIGPVLKDSMDAMCSIWPQGALDDDLKRPLDTALPVLLLSGEADPITPPEYALRAAVDLRNARLLTGPAQGHGLLPRGCTPDIVADFVAAASLDDLDADCLDDVFAMPFFLDFGGPAP